MALDIAKILTVINLLETLKRTPDIDEDTADHLNESIVPLRLILLGSNRER